MKILYDAKLKRPACVLLQAAAMSDYSIANRFPSESWLVYPTPDMKIYEVTPEQLDYLVKIATPSICKRGVVKNG